MSILFFVRCWTIGNYGHEMFPWLNQIWDLLGPAVLEKKKKNYVICVILCIFSWNNLKFYVNYVFHVILLPRKQLLRSFWTIESVPKKKGNNRMLLEPRCTSSIVSSRHPLGLKNRFNFGYIYPSQRHNLTPILEIMTQISQIFPVISKISKTNPKFSRNFPNPQRGHRMDQRGRRRKFQIFHFFPENFQNSGYTT